RHVLVFSGDQPWCKFDDRHFAAEAAIDLGEFEADIATSNDDEMVGKSVDLHHGAVGQIVDLVEASDRWSRSPPADVDENLLSFQQPVADRYLTRRNEPSMAVIDGASLQIAQPLFDPAPGSARDHILAGFHRLHVDTDFAVDRYAELAGSP